MEQYCKQKHDKVPQIPVQRRISKVTCTQTGKINIDENNKYIVKTIETNRKTRRRISRYKL